MHMFGKYLKDLKHEVKNSGDTLTITISGDTEKIANLEKKLNAVKELCCDDEGHGS